MKNFSFQQPACLEDLYTLLEEHGNDLKLLAGGTDLTVELRHGKSRPGVVVDLKRITDLPSSIVKIDGELCIGAAATISEIVAHDDVIALYPALLESAVVVGSIQIRNRATLTGNVCNASPAADTVPVLAAYGAKVVLRSRGGERLLQVTDFILGNRDIDLSAGEVVSEIRIPLPEGPRGCAFARLTRRRGVDLATINVACTLQASGQTVFALGAAAPQPVIVTDKELIREERQGKDIRPIIDRLMQVAKPISDVRASADYRYSMFSVIADRAFRTALTRLDAQTGGS